MERREKILNGLNVATMSGIEIGPLAWPIVRKSDGDITYVDFTDADTLRKNHGPAGRVPIDQIVEVDAIWGANTLQQAIGEQRKVDYIIASHVVEHVPDLLEWLEELRAVLKPGGQIRLVVPDRRFTFDYLRRETKAEDVLAAHAIKARVPQPQQILEYFLNYVDVDRMAAWKGTLGDLKPNTTVQQAMALVESALKGEYNDVHCWVFTPKSIGSLFARLAKDGLIDLECTHFQDTDFGEYEFFVGLRSCEDREQVVSSWEAVAASAIDLVDPKDVEIETLLTEVARLAEKVASIETERAAATAEITALRTSTSWVMTKPLRAVSERLRRSTQ
ncbi:methyltransferase domain-containing protein [Paraburkholderia caribensis]|uniref:methyltransferase domain-containing protein n=1 Tax=Paraburkholderia caribensis TaxID=75105 RepID=UPI001CACD5F3|nr:class I SAM-dependent methyltransferase [Paraburkholderia caribensis]CAG9267969.1 Methyltransferase type 12 [Paraburkholderia caribensis]